MFLLLAYQLRIILTNLLDLQKLLLIDVLWRFLQTIQELVCRLPFLSICLLKRVLIILQFLHRVQFLLQFHLWLFQGYTLKLHRQQSLITNLRHHVRLDNLLWVYSNHLQFLQVQHRMPPSFLPELLALYLFQDKGYRTYRYFLWVRPNVILQASLLELRLQMLRYHIFLIHLFSMLFLCWNLQGLFLMTCLLFLVFLQQVYVHYLFWLLQNLPHGCCSLFRLISHMQLVPLFHLIKDCLMQVLH